MASITNLVATTELEAVNAMLAAAGEKPITGDPASSTRTDVAMALNLLRNVTRAVLTKGWKFNTEFGYEVAPADQLVWEDTAGDSTELNIFTPPAGLISFDVTQLSEQQGSKKVDTAIRPSRIYEVGGEPALVFYDRHEGRDGFPVDDRDYLYINPVWLFDFEQMPETARRLCAIRAARQFVQSVLGSDTLRKFTVDDERDAWKDLKREQGLEDEYHIMKNASVLSIRGRRPGGPTGVLDLRKNRNHT